MKVGVVVNPLRIPNLKASSISFKLAESKYNSIIINFSFNGCENKL
jgi:hypothetical protein